MIPNGVQRYIAFMTTLSPESLALLADIATEDIHFRDPFNDVRGLEHFRRCLVDMLEQLAELQIDVSHVAALQPTTPDAQGSNQYVLYWTFGGQLLKLGRRAWQVSGTSVITLAADGRVSEHLDYWDAAGGLYESVPILGALMRFLRRRLAVK